MHLLLETIELRPYVFIFLASFLFIAIANFGVRTTLLFSILTYIVALGSEWSSVHNGFPFGLYHYLDATRGRELWVAGVPFFDSLSFTFLAFASYTLALLLCSPLYRRGLDLRILDTRKIRRAPRVWLMAALFMVMIDMIVDPLSVRGNRWFLGKIFWYDPPGAHFGVPISNYLGWYFVAAITIPIFLMLDATLNRGARKPRGVMETLPSRALLGPALYLGMVAFGLTTLFRIGAANIGWAGVFIYLPFVTLAIHILTREDSYGDTAALERHLADFPYERGQPIWKDAAGRGSPALGLSARATHGTRRAARRDRFQSRGE
ncbi:MAG TPA: carotenoid biosynthesis protein [Candidatus Binataceae bacterium]|nr:carotenoid biosynthesis protein [Candidatus Binataceae bacterium]